MALMSLAPTTQAVAGDPDTTPDGNGPDRASTDNVAKDLSVAERTSLLRQVRSDQDQVARQIGLPGVQSLQARTVMAEADGDQHVRYDRTFKGLPVIGGDLVVHTDSGGAVTGVQRAATGAISVPSTQATTPRAAAKRTAAAKAGYRPRSTSADLAVFASDGADRLVWDAVVRGVRKDQTPSRLHVLVDARTGKVLASWDEIHTGQGESIYSGSVEVGTRESGGQYEMVDTERGNSQTINLHNQTSGGDLFTDADDQWGDGTAADPQSAAVDAHYGAATTWDYYLDVHNRHGIFDDGQGVPSRVHYGDSYVNAFWDGQQMTYGDGAGNQNPLTELDVAAHEMSHGVTEATAGLVYYGDAGGLNEATSDIFGTAVEFYADNAEDVPDYYMGEEIDINGDGTPLRYMDQPSRDGASYDCWSGSVGNDDPHYSSGPANHFFYLASEGSGQKEINGETYDSPTCDGSTVEGIGREKVEQVWFRALSTYFTSTTTYPEARDATLQSAIDLYGAGSPECTGIADAWTAIDVPAGDVSCG